MTDMAFYRGQSSSSNTCIIYSSSTYLSYNSRRTMEGSLHASYISKTFQHFDDWKKNFQNRLKQLRTLHVYGATRSS